LHRFYDLNHGLAFAVDDTWTPEQALAVMALLDDLSRSCLDPWRSGGAGAWRMARSAADRAHGSLSLLAARQMGRGTAQTAI